MLCLVELKVDLDKVQEENISQYPLQANLVSPSLAISGLHCWCSHHYSCLGLGSPSLPSAGLWRLPSKELKRWETKYSFQMNLNIENRYLPTISWDFKIFLIYLIITQSPGNSYCSTVLASLPSPSTAAQVQSWPKKNDSKFNLSHCGRGGGHQSKWLVSSLNLQNHSGLFNWPPLKVLSASR